MLITPFYLPSVGGVQFILYNICKRLPPDEIIVMRSRDPLDDAIVRSFNSTQRYRIIENKFYTPSPDPRYDLDDIEEEKFIQKSIWNRLFIRSRFVRLFYYLLSIVTTLFTIKKYRINAVWCGYPSTKFIVISILARYFLATPYFVHTYGEELPSLHEQSTIVSFLESYLIIVGLKKSYKVFALSTFGKNCLSKVGLPDDKIILRNPGVDISRFQEDPIEVAKLKEKYGLVGKKVILSVGNITQRKGIDILIELLPELNKVVPDLIYIVVGKFIGNAEEEKIKKIITNNNVEDKVIFIGEVQQERIASYFYASDVLCLATRENKEGFGMVFIEANACKKPVVGFDTGGVGDAIINGETGLLVKYGDIDGFKKAILTILNDETYAKELGMKGYKRVVAELTWDRYARDIYGAIKRIH